MKYIRQLDSLRAIAVIMVIFLHWFPASHKLRIAASAFYGVDIFYVLSGFLITGILLKNRNEADESGASKIGVVKSFFIRRFLRIFPVYYLLLFLLYFLGPATGTNIRGSLLYFITFTSNLYFFKLQAWDGILSHFWSIAVEEQFYLVWPWLMLFLNRRYLLPFILAFIFVGIATRFYLLNVVLGGILTFTCFDALGSGALLAWVLVYKPLLLKKFYPALSVVAFISCSLAIASVIMDKRILIIPLRTRTSICTVWLISSIILNEKKKSILFFTILNNRILIFIGKISYGVYLYHLVLPYFVSGIFHRLNTHLPAFIYRHNFSLIRLENFCLLILISYLSWRIIERPVLKLKKHFEYQRPVVSEYRKVSIL